MSIGTGRGGEGGWRDWITGNCNYLEDAGLINFCIASAGPKVGLLQQLWSLLIVTIRRFDELLLLTHLGGRQWVVISVSPESPFRAGMCPRNRMELSQQQHSTLPFRILLDSWPRCFSGLEIEGHCCGHGWAHRAPVYEKEIFLVSGELTGTEMQRR